MLYASFLCKSEEINGKGKRTREKKSFVSARAGVTNGIPAKLTTEEEKGRALPRALFLRYEKGGESGKELLIFPR